jgi:hypothetical protein
MGFLSFLGGSYKPKDFVGKTIDQIFKDMKLDKMDTSIKEHEEYAGLSEEIKGAIDLLLDLKAGKTIVYEKCYKGRRTGVAAPAPAAHHVARPASARPASARPAAGPVARPVSVKPHPAPAVAALAAAVAAPVAEKADEDKEEGMSGGGKRRRKSRKGKKSKRRSHKKKRKTARR